MRWFFRSVKSTPSRFNFCCCCPAGVAPYRCSTKMKVFVFIQQAGWLLVSMLISSTHSPIIPFCSVRHRIKVKFSLITIQFRQYRQRNSKNSIKILIGAKKCRAGCEIFLSHHHRQMRKLFNSLLNKNVLALKSAVVYDLEIYHV